MHIELIKQNMVSCCCYLNTKLIKFMKDGALCIALLTTFYYVPHNSAQ